MNHTEVAIAGGGIVGLASALELAAAGRQVTVFERGSAMSEASWAAAGMLAAHDPENPPALQSLSDLSLALYPQFLAKVERLSGLRIPIRTRRTIQCAQHLPNGFHRLDSATLAEMAQGIVVDDRIFFAIEEISFDPRDMARALPLAVRAADVPLLEDTAVLGATESGGHVRLQTGAGEWHADAFLNTCGAWAASLGGTPVFPRKGQMTLVESHAGSQLQVVLRTPEIYLVPRGNGRIVVGATVEDADFDKRVEPAAIASLLDTAAALWPPVREAKIVDSWAGLRPSTADELPVIDAYGRRSWIAAGHYRNGILLAPATARLVRQMILREAPDIDLTPFRCGRFASSSVHS